MRIERPLLITVLMLALCGPARAQFPSASPSAATKPKESDVPLRKPPPQDDVDVRVEDMKLLEPGIGWAELSVDLPTSERDNIEKSAYWTTDNGKHWRNITPPPIPKEDLSDLFFLDTHHGWAIFDQSAEAKQTQDPQSKLRLALASTTDAGATWSNSQFSLALGNYFSQQDLSILNSIGVSGIAFADQLHGWLQLSFWIGMHGHASLLLITSDGGKTWIEASNYAGPNFPEMLLVTRNEGWVFGTVEPDGAPNSLFVTRDRTKSWQELSAMPSSQFDGNKEWHELSIRPRGESEEADSDVHGLPVFQDPTYGFLEEDCTSDETDSTHTTVLFATTEGGRTWKEDRMLRNFAGLCNSSTVVDSVWIAPVKHGGHLVLLRVEAGATLDAGKDNGSNSQDYTLCDTRLSFVTPAQGWMLADHSVLQSTTDGGRTWTTITPGGNHK